MGAIRPQTPDRSPRQAFGGNMLLPTLSDNANAVVLEVPEAVSPALDELHFAVKAFGNTIVFCKSPHAGNGIDPGLQGLGEGFHVLIATV